MASVGYKECQDYCRADDHIAFQFGDSPVGDLCRLLYLTQIILQLSKELVQSVGVVEMVHKGVEKRERS